MDDSPVSELIRAAIANGLPFVAYRLPDAEAPIFAAQTSPVPSPGSSGNFKGFLISDFTSSGIGEARFIKPDLLWKFPQEEKPLLQKMTAGAPLKYSEPKPSTSREEYQKEFKGFMDSFQSGKVQKAVLSRIIQKPLKSDFRHDLFFLELSATYPSAFTYLLYHPDFGIWSGATPEILLSLEDKSIITMALAGTRPSSKGNPPEWGNKELEEHAYVSDFIAETFEGEGMTTAERNGPYSQVAGEMEHLKTEFRYGMNDKTDLLKIAYKLHPTPAVCGIPAREAKNLILQEESHSRSLYTGFLGPYGLCGKTSFFVNLRCVNFFPGKCNIYVGGGLTIQSTEEDEWQETELKATTILRVLEKM